jgi:hypothetical protein
MFPEDDTVVFLGAPAATQRPKSKYYQVYKSKIVVQRLLQEGRAPISVISAHTKVGGAHLYASVFRNAEGRESLITIEPTIMQGERAGCFFWEWKEVEASGGQLAADLDDIVIDDPLVLLPLLRRGVGLDGIHAQPQFYAISRGWKELDSDGRLLVYRIPNTIND